MINSRLRLDGNARKRKSEKMSVSNLEATPAPDHEQLPPRNNRNLLFLLAAPFPPRPCLYDMFNNL